VAPRIHDPGHIALRRGIRAPVEAILIAIGAVAGLTPVSAVVVTLVIGTLLAFAAVLHGSVASGAPAMTVVYVAATTVAVPLDRAWTMLASWASRRN